MSPEILRHALSVAHAAADAASVGIRRRYRALDFSVDTKSDQTPVTEADREAESTIKRVLREAFPDHAFYGEEEGREGEGDFLWLIDPIDGTRAFVRGYPMFSTQIALMHRGQLVLGVSDACEYGERAWATHGCGAFFALNPQPQRDDYINGEYSAFFGFPVGVSSASEFDAECAISTGNLKSLAANSTRWNALAGLIGRVGRIRGYGDFLHYHLLARGAIDLVIESDLNILDIAALVVIVREAGGTFTDLYGKPIGLDTRSALAGNATLHAQALAVFPVDANRN